MSDSFRAEVEANIAGLGEDRDLQALSRVWVREIARHKYAYNFRWMGRPIIQFPQDMLAMQEIVWDYRPDVIVETGVAHGGSIIYYASLLHLLGEDGFVVGVDIEVRPHNRAAIEAHSMANRVQLIEGSSVDASVVEQVRHAVRGRQRPLVVLDSNHTHDHVLAELRAYSPLVRAGGYLVVFDTLVEHMPADLAVANGRSWGPGNNPLTAVREFLRENDRFEVDEGIEHKLLITVAPGGYLRCLRDPDDEA